MNIVILDDIVINSKQKERLKTLGDVRIFSGVPNDREEIISRAKDADIIICGWAKLNSDILDSLDRLKMISVWATGYDNVDVEKATEKGIAVCNIPGYARDSVAELAIGLMISVLRYIPQADNEVRITKELNWKLFKGYELQGKTLGIVGMGTIGRKVAKIAKGFEMNLLAYDVYTDTDLEKELGFKFVSLDRLFKDSDVITLHLPLLEQTKNLITGKYFDMLEKPAIFINTARADLVNQEDLVHALKNKKVVGAGLDDINLSHNSADTLLELNNVIITPHMGFYTKESTIKKTEICINNIENYIMKKPVNVISKIY